jgi:hypothetical protein
MIGEHAMATTGLRKVTHVRVDEILATSTTRIRAGNTPKEMQDGLFRTKNNPDPEIGVEVHYKLLQTYGHPSANYIMLMIEDGVWIVRDPDFSIPPIPSPPPAAAPLVGVIQTTGTPKAAKPKEPKKKKPPG